jgi:Rrf2 family protein
MVNQQFTFAVHILTVLAFAGRVVDSCTLAASVNTNPVVVRRLLLALRRARLIQTYAGKHGGAKLLKPPARISLLEVYQAVQTPSIIALNERKAARHCPVSCNMKRVMSSVAAGTDQAVKKHLRQITLQKVLRKIG